MQITFNNQGLINGFYILKVLPKCNIHAVNLIPTGKDEYFVDGYKYGGFSDFSVKYDKVKRSLSLKSDNESFTALKTR